MVSTAPERQRERVVAAPAPQRLDFSTIVVPLDGSRFARAALAPAKELASRLDARLVLVQAVTPARVPGIEASLALSLGETDAARSVGGAAAQLEDEGLEVSQVLIQGPLAAAPAEAILAAVEECAAGLIVMATHGRTGVKRALVGSVADAVVSHAPVPVILIRPVSETGRTPAPSPGPAGARPSVVVALDGSPASEAALAPACELAQALDATVELVRVLPEETSLGVPADRVQYAKAEATAYLERMATYAAEFGAGAEAVRYTIPPADGMTVAEALLAHATSQGASVVVLATHARRGVHRLLKGSVAAEVVAHASIPICVVRAGVER